MSAELFTAEAFDDAAAIDRWHEGYFAARDGAPRPAERDAGEGWDEYQRDRRVRPAMPARPEGYYHAPIGAYD